MPSLLNQLREEKVKFRRDCTIKEKIENNSREVDIEVKTERGEVTGRYNQQSNPSSHECDIVIWQWQGRMLWDDRIKFDKFEGLFNNEL